MPRIQRLLEDLSNAFGPSGFEGQVRAIVRREMGPLTDNLETCLLYTSDAADE